MKATKIYVEKCFNLGGYENMKIGIELEVEAGEKARDVLAKGREFLSNYAPGNNLKEADYSKAQRVLSDPDNYLVREVKAAQELINSNPNGPTDDLPF